VRRLQEAVAVSVAVHAAVVAIVLRVDDDARPEHETTVPRIELADVAAPTEPPPLEVAMLSPDELVRLDPGARPQPPPPDESSVDSRRPARSAPLATAVAPGRSTAEIGPTTDAPASDGTTTEPGRPPLFDMRRGRVSRGDLKIGRATDYRDALDHVVPPGMGAKPEVPATGKLQPDGGGTARRDEGVFHAKIAKDGSVTLRDGPDLTINVPLAHPLDFVRDFGHGVEAWYRDDNKPIGSLGRPKPLPDAPRVNLQEAIDGQYNARELNGNGTVINPGAAPIPVAGGGFDLTDKLMRSKGMDPYASRKLAFLDSTRDERVAMGQRYRAEQLAQASRIMKRHLDRVATIPDPAARKRALFELWDECLEVGSEAEVTAGRASRALIIGYIRTHVPAGSAHAYTSEEIAELDARKSSTAVFAPYE